MQYLLLTLFFVSSAGAITEVLRPWQSLSDPAIMSKKFIRTFSELPLSGQAKESKKYWSNDYWPFYKGNINFRWNAPVPIGFNLDSPDLERALRMSEQELAQLAPSEKFDLLSGNYSYPLLNEVKKRASPNRKEWEGICHGWASAALNHNEPEPKIMTNKDGLKIPFGSSDIKAILSYYYASHYNPVSTHQMGERCKGVDPCRNDMNAGAFHIVLTNKVGLEQKSYITDIDRGKEVWNHVVLNYKTFIIDATLPPSYTSAKGTVKVIRVKSVVRYVMNLLKNSWLPVNGTNLQSFQDYLYEYELDIDKSGKIIGGDWISNDRPDFLWLVAPTPEFKGIFSELKNLLNDDEK